MCALRLRLGLQGWPFRFKRQPQNDFAATLVRVEHLYRLPIAVKDSHSLSGIGKAHAMAIILAAPGNVMAARTVIGQDHLQHAGLTLCTNGYSPALDARRYGLLHGIFDQRLQQQAGQ